MKRYKSLMDRKKQGKLDPAIVIRIRREATSAAKRLALASELGLSMNSIWAIFYGTNYAWVLDRQMIDRQKNRTPMGKRYTSWRVQK